MLESILSRYLIYAILLVSPSVWSGPNKIDSRTLFQQKVAILELQQASLVFFSEGPGEEGRRRILKTLEQSGYRGEVLNLLRNKTARQLDKIEQHVFPLQIALKNDGYNVETNAHAPITEMLALDMPLPVLVSLALETFDFYNDMSLRQTPGYYMPRAISEHMLDLMKSVGDPKIVDLLLPELTTHGSITFFYEMCETIQTLDPQHGLVKIARALGVTVSAAQQIIKDARKNLEEMLSELQYISNLPEITAYVSHGLPIGRGRVVIIAEEHSKILIYGGDKSNISLQPIEDIERYPSGSIKAIHGPHYHLRFLDRQIVTRVHELDEPRETLSMVPLHFLPFSELNISRFLLHWIENRLEVSMPKYEGASSCRDFFIELTGGVIIPPANDHASSLSR